MDSQTLSKLEKVIEEYKGAVKYNPIDDPFMKGFKAGAITSSLIILGGLSIVHKIYNIPNGYVTAATLGLAAGVVTNYYYDRFVERRYRQARLPLP